MAKSKNLCWIDLETTGLDPNLDPILEVGMIVTVAAPPFVEIATYETAVIPNATRHPNWRASMNGYVTRMHTQNGLLADVDSPSAKPIGQVEQEMIAVLKSIWKGNFMLSGSGVGHFDYWFLKAQMPEFTKMLQYSTLDVGVMRRAFSYSGRSDLDSFGKTFASKGDKPHRGLADVSDHLNEFRAYAKMFEQITLNPQET